MSRDMAMMISTIMANLQNTRRLSKTLRSHSIMVVWLSTQDFCDGETFPVEGEQWME
jgi:hypothetical protein